MKYIELNFDSIVGPTHLKAGLSVDNMASAKSKNIPSNPKEAALQGLEKAMYLSNIGILQAILPPLDRPHMEGLRNIGFTGSDYEVIQSAYDYNPHTLAAFSSASSMWLANSGTFTPSSDSLDGKLHFLPANLSSKLHRCIEAGETYDLFSNIFSTLIESNKARVHKPLISHHFFGDEGAANHMRLSSNRNFLHALCYGRSTYHTIRESLNFTPRQSLEASHAIARNNLIPRSDAIFVQTNPISIDEGVFHNDVISVNCDNYLLLHEMSYAETDLVLNNISNHFRGDFSYSMATIDEIPFEDVIESYLFNSQIVRNANGNLELIASQRVFENSKAREFVEKIISEEKGISSVAYFDLSESMANGGGPACLRLKTHLNKYEIDSLNGNLLLTETLYNELCSWIERHYRDRLILDDLRDPQFYDETRVALEELTQILMLPEIYKFMK